MQGCSADKIGQQLGNFFRQRQAQDQTQLASRRAEIAEGLLSSERAKAALLIKEVRPSDIDMPV